MKTHRHEEDAATLEQFLDTKLEARRLFSELLGTFFLVLAGAGGAAVHYWKPDEVTTAMAVIAPGIMVMAAIYFMGAVGGAHLNPAVTFAFSLRRNFPWKRVPGYIAAQFVGGIFAVYFLRLIFGEIANHGGTVPSPELTPMAAFLLEAALTMGLVSTILGTASGARNIGTNGAIAVGGYIALAGMWSAPATGASMNPIRSLAPDILRGDFSTTWIYIAGPFLGALIGVAIEWALKGEPTAFGTEAAQGEPSGGRDQKKK